MGWGLERKLREWSELHGDHNEDTVYIFAQGKGVIFTGFYTVTFFIKVMQCHLYKLPFDFLRCFQCFIDVSGMHGDSKNLN